MAFATRMVVLQLLRRQVMKCDNTLNIPVTSVRKIYNFTGIEWTYERDRMLQEKLNPYQEMEQAKKSVTISSANLSEQEIKKLKAIQMEFQVQLGDITDYIMDYEWIEMIPMNLRKRASFTRLLLVRANGRKKKMAAANSVPEQELTTSEDEKEKDTFMKFVHIVSKEKVGLTNKMKLFTAKQYGIPLVLDFSYDSLMGHRAMQSLVKQVVNVYGENRDDPEPFNLTLSNVKMNERFATAITNSHQLDVFFWDLTEQCHTELYPRDRLVYLSPHSKRVLTHFDPTKVYVIGAYVDLGHTDNESLKRAKNQGIPTAALPLRQTQLVQNRYSLNMDTVVSILLKLKQNNNMRLSVDQSIPNRLKKQVFRSPAWRGDNFQEEDDFQSRPNSAKEDDFWSRRSSAKEDDFWRRRSSGKEDDFWRRRSSGKEDDFWRRLSSGKEDDFWRRRSSGKEDDFWNSRGSGKEKYTLNRGNSWRRGDSEE